MITPDCKDCVNVPAFEEYANAVTAHEELANARIHGGCSIGSIACQGAIKNPVFGNFCAAKLEQPIVPERPEAVALISPASSIEEISGYDMYAKKR